MSFVQSRSRTRAVAVFAAYQGKPVRHFTPNWFAATMGTGILSIVLAQFPSLPLLFAVGHALWLLNIMLFCLCLGLYGARWILYPSEAARIFGHSVASLFLGCIPMGLATIINGILIYGVAAAPETATAIAMALWWVDVALSLACGLAVPFLMFTRQTHELPGMTALWLLPVVACEVASVSGGLLIAHVANADTQLTILVTSLVLWACSVPLALSILAILFMRLVLHKLPPVGMAATSWLALGPIGTGALSLLVMSQTAPPVLAAHGLGTIASAFAGSCLLGGLLLWGYGIWWLGMACLMTLRYLRDRIPFNLGWWGYTFPLGVFAAATARLSTIIPIGPIGWLVAALALALALVWLLVFVRTMSGILDRSLFVSPCLAAD